MTNLPTVTLFPPLTFRIAVPRVNTSKRYARIEPFGNTQGAKCVIIDPLFKCECGVQLCLFIDEEIGQTRRVYSMPEEKNRG